jgi:4-hydroxybenzoate polyprenyltransferase
MGATADPLTPGRSSERTSRHWRTWLQLLRVPNLFTVPGDPLAGFLLATFGVLHEHAIFAVAASFCFYAAGLLLNDLCDLEEDRRERQARPLPSGAANVRTVRVVTIALALAGFSFLAMGAGWRGVCLGFALGAAIAAYNTFTKHWEIIGALNMGLCRALSLYAGSVAAFPTAFPRTKSVILGASILGIYIAAVTNLARHETNSTVPVTAKLFPLCAALLGMVLLSLGTGTLFLSPAAACAACAVVLVLRETILLFRRGAGAEPLPPRIGGLIRLLLLLQAALCLVTPLSEAAWACAIALLLFYPLHGWFARRFYAS